MSHARGLILLAVAAALSTHAATSHAQTVTRHTSPAGLAFRYMHMPEEHSQALAFAWKDGTAVALPGKEALPTLATALIMEGPRGLSRSAMIEDLRDLRATVNLGATVSVVQGNIVAPRERFAEAVRLFARTLADPALSADRFAEMVKSRAVASAQAAGNAEALAQRLLARLTIGDGAYRRHAADQPAMFERVTLDDIDRWRKNTLVRQGLILAAAGPMTPAEAADEIDRLFVALPQEGKAVASIKPTLRASGKLVVLERPVVQTVIAAGGPMALTVAPDLVRTQLAVAVLGGGPSGRLWRAVRERLGAAYGISTSLQAVDLDTRTLFIRTVVANDKAKGALAAIRDEYARFIAEGVAEEELAPLQRVFVTNHRDRLRRAQAVAGNLLTQALHDYPDDYLATYERRVGSYGRAAIDADVRTRFPKPPLTMVVVTPSSDGLVADCLIKSPEELARCN
jgi:zinc protease